MLRERSARRRTEAGEGARQEERDKDPDRDRDRRSEVGLGLGWGSAPGRGPGSVPGSSQPGLAACAPGNAGGKSRSGAGAGAERGGAARAGALPGPGRGRTAALSSCRRGAGAGTGRGAGTRRADPETPEKGCRPHPQRDRSSPARAPPRPPHPLPGRTSPASPFPAAAGVPARRAPRERGLWAPPGLRPRARSGRGEPGVCRGREERGQPFLRSSRAPGPRAELPVCPRVPVSVLRRPQELALTVPRVGHRLLPALPAELGQLPTAVLCPAIHKVRLI
ncbi:translation initiation factor IF-2-like [Manacus candei]|uniref:translation initiation factor IF-2-like n=1 Tax=Manacus candei TaxID=415023 RepID=UPI00222637DA|nr:translation initiation factor IF-2-like [Manacus candei]XP_051631143.1 translation initiation factor IF-2-like [Manacus candei]